MEILDMTFAGIPIGILIAVVAGWYFVRSAWRKWRQDFADIKEIEEAHKKFRAESEASIAENGSAKKTVVPATT